MIILLATTVLAQKKVYEVTNTPESFGGLYVETDKPYKFQKLGGPDADGYHFFLYKKRDSTSQWFIGDGKKGDTITNTYYARAFWPKRRVPPENDWKGVDFPNQSQEFNVIARPGVMSTVKDIETYGGALTSDSGIVCLQKKKSNWILLELGDKRLCDQNQDCKNGLDENTQCQQEITRTTTTSARTTINTIRAKLTSINPENPNSPNVLNENDNENRISPSQTLVPGIVWPL